MFNCDCGYSWSLELINIHCIHIYHHESVSTINILMPDQPVRDNFISHDTIYEVSFSCMYLSILKKSGKQKLTIREISTIKIQHMFYKSM